MRLAHAYPYFSAILRQRIRSHWLNLASVLGMVTLLGTVIAPDQEESRFIGAFTAFAVFIGIRGISKTADEKKCGRLESIYWSPGGHAQTIIAVLLGINAIEFGIAVILLIAMPMNLWMCYCCIMCISAFWILGNLVWSLHTEVESSAAVLFWIGSPATLWLMRRYSGDKAIAVEWGHIGLAFLLLNGLWLVMQSTTVTRMFSHRTTNLAGFIVPSVLLIMNRHEVQYQILASAIFVVGLYLAHITLSRVQSVLKVFVIAFAYSGLFAVTCVFFDTMANTIPAISDQSSQFSPSMMAVAFIAIRGAAILCAWHCCLPSFARKETVAFVASVAVVEFICVGCRVFENDVGVCPLAFSSAGFAFESITNSSLSAGIIAVVAWAGVLAAACMFGAIEPRMASGIPRASDSGEPQPRLGLDSSWAATFPLLSAFCRERLSELRYSGQHYSYAFNAVVSIGVILYAMPDILELVDNLPIGLRLTTTKMRGEKFVILAAGLLLISLVAIAWGSIGTFGKHYQQGVVAECIRSSMPRGKIVIAYLFGPRIECIAVSILLFIVLFGYGVISGNVFAFVLIVCLAGILATTVQLCGMALVCFLYARLKWQLWCLSTLVAITSVVAGIAHFNGGTTKAIEGLVSGNSIDQFSLLNLARLVVVVLATCIVMLTTTMSGMKNISDSLAKCNRICL